MYDMDGDGKIHIDDLVGYLSLVTDFDEDTTQQVEEYQEFINLIIGAADIGDIKALCFNPNETMLAVEGYSPRSKAPYFLINMAYMPDLTKAHRSLKKTQYYDKMPKDYINYLGIKI